MARKKTARKRKRASKRASKRTPKRGGLGAGLAALRGEGKLPRTLWGAVPPPDREAATREDWAEYERRMGRRGS